MPTSPQISIIIPAYNHERFVTECLDSVQDQTQVDCETIVIDDCSRDATYETALAWSKRQSARITVLRNETNLGLNQTLAVGLGKTSGQLIAVIASDDLFTRDRLMRMSRHFDDPTVAVVYANGRVLRDGRREGSVHTGEIARLLARSDPRALHHHIIRTIPSLFTQAMMIRKDFLLAIGGFEKGIVLDDWPLHLRILGGLTSSLQRARMVFDNFTSFLYRLHGANSYLATQRQRERVVQVADRYATRHKDSAFIKYEIMAKYDLRLLRGADFASASLRCLHTVLTCEPPATKIVALSLAALRKLHREVRA